MLQNLNRRACLAYLLGGLLSLGMLISFPGAAHAQTVVFSEVESSGVGTLYGRWELVGGRIQARWNNGALATIQVVGYRGNQIVFDRWDYAGPSRGIYIRYVGNVVGNSISGSFYLYQNGRFNYVGTWSARR